MSDYIPIEQEYNFDEVQDQIKEILRQRHKMKKEKADKFVDNLVLENPSQVKALFDRYMNFKSPEKLADVLYDKFYKKTKVNIDNNQINNLAIGTETIPDKMSGDRGLNQMEKKVLNFQDFLKQNL
jgi:ribosomal protein S15P/S13E